MDRDGFEEHLQDTGMRGGGNFDAHSIGLLVGKINAVEEKLGNLIRKKIDGRQKIYDTLTNVENDANRNQNQLDMEWTERTPPDTVSAIRDAIKNYRRFLGDFPSEVG